MAAISSRDGRIVVGALEVNVGWLTRPRRPAADASVWETQMNVTATANSKALLNFTDVLLMVDHCSKLEDTTLE